MLDDKDMRLVLGEDGKRYTVVSYAIDDGDGRVRMSVTVTMAARRRWCRY